jgi:hypothetical protein
MNDLINHSTPKPPPPTNWAKDIIEPTRELEPNKKMLLVHAPFIMHDAMVGAFSLLQSHFESNDFIEALY